MDEILDHELAEHKLREILLEDEAERIITIIQMLWPRNWSAQKRYLEKSCDFVEDGKTVDEIVNWIISPK